MIEPGPCYVCGLFSKSQIKNTTQSFTGSLIFTYNTSITLEECKILCLLLGITRWLIWTAKHCNEIFSYTCFQGAYGNTPQPKCCTKFCTEPVLKTTFSDSLQISECPKVMFVPSDWDILYHINALSLPLFVSSGFRLLSSFYFSLLYYQVAYNDNSSSPQSSAITLTSCCTSNELRWK